MYERSSRMKKDTTFSYVSDEKKILKYLTLGINIPISQEYHKYIIHDLRFFRAQSIVLKYKSHSLGHVLVYDEHEHNPSTLYFGYFGVDQHQTDFIILLLEELVSYGKTHHYKKIKGPINIPTVIYGWGFMEEGSLEDLYAGRPVNPPIYQHIFFNHGFTVVNKEVSWEGPLPVFDPFQLDGYNFQDYEVFHPQSISELMELKPIFQQLHNENMPPGSIITPRINELFENYVDYIIRYGGLDMFFFARHKPSNKIVACGSNLPNPFRKDHNGKQDSFVAFTVVINAEHQNKGLVILLTGVNFLQMRRRNMRYLSGPANNSHEISTHVARKLGLNDLRTHLILELNI